MRLSQELKDKRPQYKKRYDKVILEHDNACPMSQSRSKHTWEMGSPTPARRILQTLLFLPIICFD